MTRPGPLSGLRIVEFAGLGPAPFAAMMLADHGAEVVRIARAGATPPGGEIDLLARGRTHLGLDLKQPAAVRIALDLIAGADGLIEGFRPGVMERLGLGPDACAAVNPALVYGRATGWGQTGPLAQAAGHDINYTALAGTLHAVGRPGEPPTPVPGFVGDFGGGGMLLAFGMVSALLAARQSGQGQVIDAAVSDGAALLATLNHGWLACDAWRDEAGVNMGDGGAPFYNTYRCADDRFIAVGAIEPPFYRELLRRCGLADDADFAPPGRQWDTAAWPAMTARLRRLFATRSRDDWCALLEGSDACFAPVLGLREAPRHPHHVARGTFGEAGGIVQPNPAPRFSRTPSAPAQPLAAEGSGTDAVLRGLGLSDDAIAALKVQQVVWSAPAQGPTSSPG